MRIQITALIKRFRFLSIVLSLSFVTTNAWSGSQSVDFLELAAVMLRDGHSDRALLALQSVDLENEDTDLARFYTLQGLAYINLNDFVAAKDSLLDAIANGQTDVVIYTYLAQADTS